MERQTAERQVSVSEAAYLVRLDQRAVRYRIARGQLIPTTGDDGHARLEVDALRRIPGWRVDPARLAELLAQEERTSEAIADRMRTLERRLARLESLIMHAIGAEASAEAHADASSAPHVRAPDGAEAWGATLTPVYAASATSGQRAESGDGLPDVSHGTYPPRRASPTLRLSSELPDGWVSWRSFAKLHHISESTVQAAVEDGRLPTQSGRWKVGQVYVKRALDADGQAAFYRIWGGMPHFERCPACPH